MNRAVLIVWVSAVTFSLGACEQRQTDAASKNGVTAAPLTAATLGEQTILSSKDYLTEGVYASADTSRGEALSTRCRACHSLEEGGGTIVGPNLFGVFGRTAGSAPNYPYSDVLSASGFVWTPRALDAWLAEPFAFLPGNRMSFPGLSEPKDRNGLIAYLLQYTDSGIQAGAVDSVTESRD
jgi:cytochrome c